MSLKAQTPREPTLPPAPPPHFCRRKPRAGMHAPASAWERGKHGQAGQEAQQPPASPAAVYPFRQCVVSTCLISLTKWPLDTADPKIRDRTHIVHALCPRRATCTYPQLLNHSVPHDYQVSALILSCRIGGKRLRHNAASVTTGRVCEKQDSAAFVRYHENSFGTSALLRPR